MTGLRMRYMLAVLVIVCSLGIGVVYAAWCPYCHESFPEDYNYCGYCGSPLIKEWPQHQHMYIRWLDMELRYIPAGAFWMGRSTKEEGSADELPRHFVCLTQGFYMSATEVTQDQWVSVMRTQPWSGRDHVADGIDYPATHISWEAAVAFCERLSQREGRHFRLPTEAEWEYACRAGTQTAYSFGDDERILGDYAWFRANAYDTDKMHPGAVGQKKANPWGLYDIHGNVYEWCSDWYGDYAKESVIDPQGPDSGRSRVLRSGTWFTNPITCRSANRYRVEAQNSSHLTGFRVVLEPGWTEPRRRDVRDRNPVRR